MAAASLLIGLVGTGLQFLGQKKAAKASKKAEKARQLQVGLEAARKRRETVRQAVVQRAQIVARGAVSGVDQADSSLQSGAGQTAAQAGRSVRNVNQGEEISNRIFSANRDIASGRELSALGAGVSSFGQQLGQSGSTFAKAFGFG